MASGKRLLHKLSARAVAAAMKSGKYGDGGGLWIMVSPTGAKRWALIFRSQGRHREMGLGAYPQVSLATARRLAEDAREKLAVGVDPLSARQDEREGKKIEAFKAETFGAFADRFLKQATAGLRNAKHAAQWKSTLDTYAASLRSKPINSIKPIDVVACVSPIWLTKTETAQRVHQRLEKVFSAAIAAGAYDALNPARLKDCLENLLPKRSGPKRVKHHASMPYADVPDFIDRLRQRTAVAALALELVILTACRSGEIRLATWGEYDADARLLRLPPERTKGGRPFEIPLTDRAVELVEKARVLCRSTEPGNYIFEGERKGRPLSVMAFDMLLRRMEREETTHGFRSSFRDWAHEKTSFRREIIEQCLSHVVGSATEMAYLRSTALEGRREIIAAWGGYIEPKAGNVVSIPAKRTGK